MRTLLFGLLGLICGFVAVAWYIGASNPALYYNGNCLIYSDTIEIPSLKDTWFEVVNPLEDGTYQLRVYRNSWSSPTTIVLSRKEVESRFMQVDCPRQPIPGE